VTLSTKPRLVIPRAIHAAMLAQAAAEVPNECCGLLAGPMPPAGEDFLVFERFALVNALASPTEFESEARGLLAAHRDMRAKNWEILAVYHSHPASPAIPSKKDRAMSYSELVATVIVSLSDGETRAWWIAGDETVEAVIITIV
jgi:[CysO sulfur-carrier protein]-S-L-cysteine hydrolase